MLVVKASAQQSPIEGLGVFTDEFIPKGTPVWIYNPKFDISFDPVEVENMSPAEKALIQKYAYLSLESRKYIYCIDDSRFINHSSTHPNCDIIAVPGEQETRAVANKDIQAGEEILLNYRKIDIKDAASDEAYLLNS